MNLPRLFLAVLFASTTLSIATAEPSGRATKGAGTQSVAMKAQLWGEDRSGDLYEREATAAEYQQFTLLQHAVCAGHLGQNLVELLGSNVTNARYAECRRAVTIGYSLASRIDYLSPFSSEQRREILNNNRPIGK